LLRVYQVAIKPFPKEQPANHHMKIKKISAIALASSVWVFATAAQSATYITGEIDVGANDSSVNVDYGAKTVSFTPKNPSVNARVSFTSGDFSGVAKDVVYKDFQYLPLAVFGENPLWSTTGVGTSASFSLTSITFMLSLIHI